MSNQTTFKSRVRETAIEYADQYRSYYVEKSYLLISDAFKKKSHYIVEAEATNYLHLLGVSTNLSPRDFYNKCLRGDLQDNDFELSFHGRDAKSSKGAIRQKILTFPNMFGILSSSNPVEEDFCKNVVRCTFATSEGSCTLGFIATPHARPMTLLRGDELNHNNAQPLKLVFMKTRSDELFSQIIVGSEADAVAYYDSLKDLITSELADRITNQARKDI